MLLDISTVLFPYHWSSRYPIGLLALTCHAENATGSKFADSSWPGVTNILSWEDPARSPCYLARDSTFVNVDVWANNLLGSGCLGDSGVWIMVSRVRIGRSGLGLWSSARCLSPLLPERVVTHSFACLITILVQLFVRCQQFGLNLSDSTDCVQCAVRAANFSFCYSRMPSIVVQYVSTNAPYLHQVSNSCNCLNSTLQNQLPLGSPKPFCESYNCIRSIWYALCKTA